MGGGFGGPEWFSAAILCPPLPVQLRSGWKWLVGSGSIHFLYCVLPLLQRRCLGINFAYMTLSSNSHYILVGMGMHWLECVIGIVGKVEWNTFVSSVTMSRGIFWNSGSKLRSFLCFQPSIYLKALTTNALTDKLFGLSVSYKILNYRLADIQEKFIYYFGSNLNTLEKENQKNK
jgi:hypothetical protein